MKRLILPLLYAIFLLALTAGCASLSPEDPTATATPLIEPSPTLRATTAGGGDPTATAIPGGNEATATTPAATVTPAPPATPTPTPTPPAFLPAPVYYLNNGQIFRMESDGLTVSRITDEAEPITEFDVAPGRGLLAYVSGNDLIQANADGNNRLVLLEGADFADDDFSARITEDVRTPLIAPSGNQIAFGLNGVNVITAGETDGQYTILRASDPYPETVDEISQEGPTRFFWPKSWSPDGSKLLLEFAYYPEGGGYAIYHLVDGRLVEISNPDFITTGDWDWSDDSETGILASNILAYGAPGLVRVDTATGTGTTLVQGMPAGEVSAENPAYLFQVPHQSTGGDIFTFAQEETNPQFMGSSRSFQIYRVSPDGSTLSLIRPEYYPADDALWAGNDLGAIFVDPGIGGTYPASGPMRWVPVDGGAVLDLAANGSNPRWGGSVGIPAGGVTEAELNALADTFAGTLDLQPGSQEVTVRPLATMGGDLWLAHTVGMRSYNPPQPHVIAAYRKTDAGWQPAGRLEFADTGDAEQPPGPDFLNEGSVRQVFVEPSHTWITVDGGIGAHGGIFYLLQYTADTFTIAASNTNASPGAGWVRDLNGDTRQEVILDISDAYVFAYATGVRLVDYDLLRWNGTALETVELVCCQGSGTAWEANDRAVALAEGELWREARTEIAQARAQAPADATIAWNEALISLIADGRETAVRPYPLLGNVFYGAYDRAVDTMRGYTPAELFSSTPPFVTGTLADSWLESSIVPYMLTFTEKALSAQPELAPAHFIRGWALYQADPADPAALESIRQAQTLAPDDTLYSQSVVHLSP